MNQLQQQQLVLLVCIWFLQSSFHAFKLFLNVVLRFPFFHRRCSLFFLLLSYNILRKAMRHNLVENAFVYLKELFLHIHWVSKENFGTKWMTCLLEHEDVILTLFELVNVNSLLLSSLANRPTIEGKKTIYQGCCVNRCNTMW